MAVPKQSGKSITTSVPSFTIRFHADDEELEAIYPSEDEADDEAEKPDEEVEAASQNANSAPTPPNTSASSTAHSRDPSPMKEYLRVLGKRSTSIDSGVVGDNSLASGSDTWRLFHELKGKITKTVEEKFGEIKSERKKRTRRFKSGGSGSKDDSSISDSESVSESSGKGQEADTDGSPKKIPSNKEIKIDEEEEGDDEENDVKNGLGNASSANSLVDMLEVSDTPTVTSTSKCKTPPPHRRKYWSHLRRRKAAKSSGKSLGATSYSMSSLARHADDSSNDFEDVDIEAGVEACEENVSASASVGDLNADIPVTDYRSRPPSSTPGGSRSTPPTLRRFSLRTQAQRFKKWLLVAACLASCFVLPTYVSGFLCGTFSTYIVYSYIIKMTSIGDCTRPKEFAIPDYAALPILEVPAVKEHHAINKHAGWMNEYPFHYEPQEYSVKDTRAVYVRLEGSVLRVSETRAKIPRRAMWNERDHSHVKFDHQRIYDISHCQVLLLPEGLTAKRLWSKKYPICIIFRKKCIYKVDVEKTKEPKDELSQEVEATEVKRTSSENDLTNFSDLLEDKPPASGSRAADKSREDRASGSEEFHDLSDTDDVDEDTFCHIDKTALEETCIFLFARTDHQKEEWYRKLATAARKGTPARTRSLPGDSPPDSPAVPPEPRHQAGGPLGDYVAPSAWGGELDYLRFMSRFHLQVQRYTACRARALLRSVVDGRAVASPGSGHSLHPSNVLAYFRYPGHTQSSRDQTQDLSSRSDGRHQKADSELQKEADRQVDCDVMWINALVGRVLFDVMGSPTWVDCVRDRFQRKLSTIKLPYFMEELAVTEMEVGSSVPMIHRASCPSLDERGLWIDLDVTYNGSFCLTLETKLNLIKLKERASKAKSEEEAPAEETARPSVDKTRSAMFDSDLEDTAESSTDVDSDTSTADEEEDSPKRRQPGTGSKILNVVNTIAASKYFQSVAENKYVKKAMREVSNTKIMLTVELKGVVGTMVVNIPPPPSNRLWYGFRTNPRVWLSAKPKLGERQLNIGHLVSYIEKKLLLEFQKKFVYPNMDDLIIPLMTPQLPK
ncbi:testis-expressed protein 2 isoform X2 [Bacillus rossius redtenbacheri]|uniref:testis-expressed protein 2 isoform X2 n=1 Tax=Bacillus rossius redtenbacheri TaxID=93214 RepID=UPI002FDE97FB